MRLELPSTSAQVDYFTSNGTWTLPPGAKLVQVLLIGGGGSGGAGRRGAPGTQRYGGGGGQGGFLSFSTYPADVMPETVTVKVGRGGNSVAGATTDDTDGAAGWSGEDTVFGALLTAGGGANGDGGYANLPGRAINTGRGQFQGGTGAADGTGFPSTYAGGGGGAGGSIGSGTKFGAAGFVGGGCGSIPGTYINTNRDGVGTPGPAPGINPNVGNAVKGADSPVGVPGSGSPGGAGGNEVGSNAECDGGAGADGCLYGGGGGGGGASGNGFTSGASGWGATGIAIITTYY